MFTIQINFSLKWVTMRNCGPYTSKHHRYGNQDYCNVSWASMRRLARWATKHMISTNGKGWWKVIA